METRRYVQQNCGFTRALLLGNIALLERQTLEEREVYNSQGRGMITATGAYGGKLCRQNISSDNMVKYCTNISQIQLRTKAEGTDWKQNKFQCFHHKHRQAGSQKCSCSWYFD